jgi:hypothetical protein
LFCFYNKSYYSTIWRKDKPPGGKLWGRVKIDAKSSPLHEKFFSFMRNDKTAVQYILSTA